MSSKKDKQPAEEQSQSMDDIELPDIGECQINPRKIPQQKYQTTDLEVSDASNATDLKDDIKVGNYETTSGPVETQEQSLSKEINPDQASSQQEIIKTSSPKATGSKDEPETLSQDMESAESSDTIKKVKRSKSSKNKDKSKQNLSQDSAGKKKSKRAAKSDKNEPKQKRAKLKYNYYVAETTTTEDTSNKTSDSEIGESLSGADLQDGDGGISTVSFSALATNTADIVPETSGINTADQPADVLSGEPSFMTSAVYASSHEPLLMTPVTNSSSGEPSLMDAAVENLVNESSLMTISAKDVADEPSLVTDETDEIAELFKMPWMSPPPLLSQTTKLSSPDAVENPGCKIISQPNILNMDEASTQVKAGISAVASTSVGGTSAIYGEPESQTSEMTHAEITATPGTSADTEFVEEDDTFVNFELYSGTSSENTKKVKYILKTSSIFARCFKLSNRNNDDSSENSKDLGEGSQTPLRAQDAAGPSTSSAVQPWKPLKTYSRGQRSVPKIDPELFGNDSDDDTELD